MTEAVLDQQEVTKRNISQLLSQLTNIYQNTRSERKEIVTQFPPDDEEFSLLEEIELLTVNLRGYASQIAATGQIVNKEQVISQLQTMRVFSVSPIDKFYFSNNGKYEQIKNYIRMLDYLRLLLLEYLQSL
ncbi:MULTISPECIES: hypothetical protein [unclassified Dolichospermum]|uniref:hypothetical protein n=1 Tax=unclassified Dolichospermum TaxID=2622029 RepID=UPI001444C79F|nr:MULTISPECIES: hypothetical protein [unclassified Dolichospermum]MTJ16742.1 hypothetical protein [Dolichospermum sp. UHCC 0299]MTJ21953.1 hypothetical protein [Dolichospermum sp. UHCC 0352]MTJ39568.1 hypothetical protein [Dolichospermum sp. UHCC 0406]